MHGLKYPKPNSHSCPHLCKDLMYTHLKGILSNKITPPPLGGATYVESMLNPNMLPQDRNYHFCLHMIIILEKCIIEAYVNSYKIDFELKKVLLPPPPPLGNFADISYLEENFKPHLLRDVCTLCLWQPVTYVTVTN